LINLLEALIHLFEALVYLLEPLIYLFEALFDSIPKVPEFAPEPTHLRKNRRGLFLPGEDPQKGAKRPLLQIRDRVRSSLVVGFPGCTKPLHL